jgi:hypothetical protein
MFRLSDRAIDTVWSNSLSREPVALKEARMVHNQSYPARILMPLFAVFALVPAQSLPSQAASEQRCREYTNSAVADYRQLRNIPQCSKLRPQDTVRWHPQQKLHFDWCLGADTASLNSESSQRDRLLLSCGGRSKL